MNSLFLTNDEVADLTGIKRGHHGKTKAQLQCEHLARVGVPYRPNRLGEPKVSREYINYSTKQEVKPAANWQPAILTA